MNRHARAVRDGLEEVPAQPPENLWMYVYVIMCMHGGWNNNRPTDSARFDPSAWRPQPNLPPTDCPP